MIRDLIARMRGPLRLEADRGYDNGAVLGGLDRYVAAWVEQVAPLISDPATLKRIRRMAAAFTGYLLVSVAQYVYMGWQYNEMSNGLLVVPLWIPQLSFLVGAALLFVAVVDELVTVLRGRKPAYVVAVEERHARGDFSEDV